MIRSRPVVGALLLAIHLSACGSTVQLTSTVADGLGAGDGLAPQTTGGSSVGTTDGTLPGGGTGAVVPGGSATGGSTGTVAAGTSGGIADGTTGTAGPATSGGRTVPVKGRGWDASTVSIGIITQNDSQQAFAAFGANGVDPGNTAAQAGAVAEEINRQGGVLGRKVKLVLLDMATLATATNPDRAGQEACTYFVEDHPVVAVVSIVTVLDYPNFRACLAKGKVPLFSSSVKAVDDKAASDLAPYFYQAIGVSWDALAPVLVSRLGAQGWFGGWNASLGAPGSGRAKVGVLVDGTTVGTRTGALFKRVLAKAGYSDSLVYQYSQASDGQSASVNYFNQNRVTHVIVTDVELTAFQNAAAGQQYKPRYGISTYNAPYANLESSGLTPPGANNGALGVGFAPTMDVSQANDPGATPGAKACQALMSKHGQSFSGKRLAQAFAYSMCDSLMLVAKGAIAGGGFTGLAIQQGIVRIGPAFKPANGFGPALTATKRFVPGIARDLAWVQDCSCMRYTATKTAL